MESIEEPFGHEPVMTSDSEALRQEKSRVRLYLTLSFFTAICFTTCNSFISRLTEDVGINSLFYFAPGVIFTSLVFNLIEFVKHYRSTGKWWVDQNIIIEGHLVPRNLLAFICYSCLYFLIQCMAFMTMFHATNAGVNVGIIITFWSINPLFMAVMDYILFGTKLAYYHLIGTFCIIICTIVVNLKDVFEEPAVDTSIIHKTAIWVPVVYGLLTPMCFTGSGMLTKHCCSDKIGFKPQRLSF